MNNYYKCVQEILKEITKSYTRDNTTTSPRKKEITKTYLRIRV